MAVYFIQDCAGNVKIGRAIDVQKRLRALQTAHAQELRLLRVIAGDAVEEWECQYAFRDARIRGEWFEYRDEMLTFEPSGSSKITLLKDFRGTRPPDDDSLVAFVREAVRRHPLKQREIASLMGYKPSQLTRKLRQSPADSSRLTLDDLELYMDVTGDTSPITYLVEKYLAETDELTRLKARIAELEGVA